MRSYCWCALNPINVVSYLSSNWCFSKHLPGARNYFNSLRKRTILLDLNFHITLKWAFHIVVTHRFHIWNKHIQRIIRHISIEACGRQSSSRWLCATHQSENTHRTHSHNHVTKINKHRLCRLSCVACFQAKTHWFTARKQCQANFRVWHPTDVNFRRVETNDLIHLTIVVDRTFSN